MNWQATPTDLVFIVADLIPRVQRMARRKGLAMIWRYGNEIEDMEQDAVVGLLAGVDKFGALPEWKIRGYLFKNAVHFMICGLRERRMFSRASTQPGYTKNLPKTNSLFDVVANGGNGRQLLRIGNLHGPSRTPLEILEARESDRRLLSAAQFRCLSLMYESGMMADEIADDVGLNCDTVSMLISTGREALRTQSPSPLMIAAISIRKLPGIVSAEREREMIRMNQLREDQEEASRISTRSRLGQSCHRRKGLQSPPKKLVSKQARYRLRIKEAGKCNRCGKPSAPYFLCEPCRIHRAKYINERNRLKREAKSLLAAG